MFSGFWHFFLRTLQLNFRSGRAIAYGYLMPVIFLLGFGSVFRSGVPLLLGQMGQILTITVLGGACLGMPTALVSERERGVWRRYQLLPVSVNVLLLGVLLVRVVIVAFAVLLQIVLAHWIYGTPFPERPVLFAGAFLIVVSAFLGLGLVVTALADDVPSVQALGQCLFLPMILIGGVGVPLVVLPDWARVVASFMPGRYAVEILQTAYGEGPGEAWFPAMALFVIGIAAAVAGLRLLRWEPGDRMDGKGWGWISIALSGWAAIGLAAVAMDRTGAVELSGAASFEAITPEEIAAISYDGLPDDSGIYTPLAPPLDGQRLTHRMQEFLPRLERWEPGRRRDPGQRVRNLVSVAAIADITQDNSERLIARMVYDHLRENFEAPELSRALAWIALNPGGGTVVTAAPELGLRGEADAEIVRERSSWYARKFLGRVVGAIPDSTEPLL